MQYRVDVSSGTVQVQNLSGAKLPDDNRVFLPLGSANYYQQRKPFDLKGMLMSPYGLMGSTSFHLICYITPCAGLAVLTEPRANARDRIHVTPLCSALTVRLRGVCLAWHRVDVLPLALCRLSGCAAGYAGGHEVGVKTNTTAPRQWADADRPCVCSAGSIRPRCLPNDEGGSRGVQADAE